MVTQVAPQLTETLLQNIELRLCSEVLVLKEEMFQKISRYKFCSTFLLIFCWKFALWTFLLESTYFIWKCWSIFNLVPKTPRINACVQWFKECWMVYQDCKGNFVLGIFCPIILLHKCSSAATNSVKLNILHWLLFCYNVRTVIVENISL